MATGRSASNLFISEYEPGIISLWSQGNILQCHLLLNDRNIIRKCLCNRSLNPERSTTNLPTTEYVETVKQ